MVVYVQWSNLYSDKIVKLVDNYTFNTIAFLGIKNSLVK